MNLNLDAPPEKHDGSACYHSPLPTRLGIDWPCNNPFQSIAVRGLELIHVFEAALGILQAYRPSRTARVVFEPRSGTGCAATEAPRGLTYHRYAIDDQGLVTLAAIIPPTSQNQAQIEDDLRAYVGVIAQTDDQTMARDCEHLVRSCDPCISCSTHALKLKVDRV